MSGRVRKWGGIFRSLHMKLVLVLILLIVSVMAVVGTFLLNRVSAFYFDEFTAQMNAVFTPALFTTLKTEAATENGSARLKEAISAYATSLGINSYRNYYILDGRTGQYLAGSDDGADVSTTSAILAAIGGRIGQETRLSKPYLDRAVPIIVDGSVKFIVYIKDTKQQMQQLGTALFSIILRGLLIALLIAIGLSFLLSKTITGPIETLTRSAKQLSRGEFEARPEVHSDDEIGVLTETFNNMAVTLRDTLATVEGERDKLGTLFLHMADGVTAFASDGTLLHINPTAEEFLGVHAEDAPSFDTLYAEAELSFSEVLELTRNGRVVERSHAVAGRTLKLLFAAYGMSESGIITVIHDITEQYKLEEARREFVANVSHELRTPLTNVKSYAETLLENPDTPPEMRERFCQVILNETDRMTRIVKDLLTLSRLDYAKMDWRISSFAVKTCIENVCRAMEMEFQHRKHTLSVTLADDLPKLSGDRERIEQVLTNILSNAAKYTPDGGEIALTAVPEGEKVRVTVTDNGIGIPKKDLPRLFERFYRVDKARSRERGGTGLGLAIAKEIIEYHGGEISIESEFKHGTTVSFTFGSVEQVSA